MTSRKISCTVVGQVTMIGWSPWVPQRDWRMSACAGDVGAPVDGPPRITFTITHGTSAMQANPRFSCLSENPGPLVAVITLAPASDAPMMDPMAAISSSIWMNRPSLAGRSSARNSAISEEGEMG